MYDILIKFGVPRYLVGLNNTCLECTQRKVNIENNLPSSFPIENDMKQGDALLPLLSNLILEYATKRYRKLGWD